MFEFSMCMNKYVHTRSIALMGIEKINYYYHIQHTTYNIQYTSTFTMDVNLLLQMCGKLPTNKPTNQIIICKHTTKTTYLGNTYVVVRNNDYP
jgi:hypothetical protein